MKSFSYTIKDAQGIHARPAGILVKKAAGFNCAITITKGEKKGDLKKVFSVMGLAAKCGDEIIVCFDGEDEELAYNEITQIIQADL